MLDMTALLEQVRGQAPLDVIISFGKALAIPFYSILYSSNEYFVGGVWLQGRSIHNHLRNLDNSLANRNSNCFSSGLDLFNIKNYWEVVERWKV